MADAIAVRIGEMLARRYPRGLNAKTIMRELQNEGITKAVVSVCLGDHWIDIAGNIIPDAKEVCLELVRV